MDPGIQTPLMIGAWRADPMLDQLSRGTTLVKLEPRTMRLLLCLARRPGEVISVGELLDLVWGGVIVGSDSVYQAVAVLRRTLGDTANDSSYIATVPRRGYRLVAKVAPIPDGDVSPPAVPPDNSALPPSRRFPVQWVAIQASVLLVGIVVLSWVQSRGLHDNVDVTPNLFAGFWAGNLETCNPSKTFSGPFTVAISNAASGTLHLIYHAYGPDGSIRLTGAYDLAVLGTNAKSLMPEGIFYSISGQGLDVNYPAVCQHGVLRRQGLRHQSAYSGDVGPSFRRMAGQDSG